MRTLYALLLACTLHAQSIISGNFTLSGNFTFTVNSNTVYPANLQSFFGKSLPVGSTQNQWPYYDTVISSAADWFAGLQSSSCSLAPDGCYVDYWDTPGTGTISATSGSNTITFSGVNPETQFCGGTTSPVNSPAIVVYTNSGANRYITGTVTGCTTTTLTVYYAIPFAIPTSTHYGYADNTMIANLGGQSTNANYYDNVVAFYNHFYRTGNVKYLTAARYLASYEWNGPYIDKGNFVNDPNGNRILHPRQIGFAGLVLWQLDQGLASWSALEGMANYYSTYGMNPSTLAATGTPLYDTREDSYAFDMSSLIALYDPNVTPKAAALTTANNIFTNVFEPAHNTSLGVSYPELSFGEASWNGSSGTVNVTNGSPTVQGVGTSWNGSETTLYFWTTTQINPTSNSYGDPLAYQVSSINTGTQTLTLTTNYTGSTATGKYWQFNNLVGIGNQMYEMGITYQALRHYYLAGGSNPSTILNRMAGIVTYLTSTSGGYTGSPEYGLWYGRMFPSCEPNPIACSGNTAENARSLTGEILAALADNYDRTRSATDLANANTLFNAMWANPGDGNGVVELNTPYGSGTAAKWFGFYGGFSLGPWWPAESLVPHS